MTKPQENYIFEFEQDWSEGDLDIEDGGMAMIYHLYDPTVTEMFVRLQSWDDEAKHKYFNECFKGRKLKVTIETVG